MAVVLGHPAGCIHCAREGHSKSTVDTRVDPGHRINRAFMSDNDSDKLTWDHDTKSALNGEETQTRKSIPPPQA